MLIFLHAFVKQRAVKRVRDSRVGRMLLPMIPVPESSLSSSALQNIGVENSIGKISINQTYQKLVTTANRHLSCTNQSFQQTYQSTASSEKQLHDHTHKSYRSSTGSILQESSDRASWPTRTSRAREAMAEGSRKSPHLSTKNEEVRFQCFYRQKKTVGPVT